MRLAELFLLGAFAGNFSDETASGRNAGADPLNLFVPGLADSWEVDIYMGWGIVLACILAVVAGARLLREQNRRGGNQSTFRFAATNLGGPIRLSEWSLSAVVIVVLGLFTPASSSITIGGVHVIHLPLPGPVQTLWQMFHVCGRIGWLVGDPPLSLACGLLLRWSGRIGVVSLAVCILAQGGWKSSNLKSLYQEFHNPKQYEFVSEIKDEAWDVIAQSGQFQHMAFASYTVDIPEYWSLVNYAAQNHWTVNCFYLAHIQRDLMENTLWGDLNTLSSDTLYVFLEGGEMNQYYLSGKLHFYRIDGILVGSVEPLPLEEAEKQPVEMNLLHCNAPDCQGYWVQSRNQITIMPGEISPIISDSWKLNPSTG